MLILHSYPPDLSQIDYLWVVLDNEIWSMEAPFHKLQDLKELLLEKIHLRWSERIHILMGQEFLVAKGGSSQGTRSCNVVGFDG